MLELVAETCKRETYLSSGNSVVSELYTVANANFHLVKGFPRLLHNLHTLMLHFYAHVLPVLVYVQE